MDRTIHQAALERLEDGNLACSHAFAIAQRLEVEPLAVGQTADAAGIRISRCQLGLFGYGPKAEGKHKVVHSAEQVPERFAARIRSTVVEGGVTCVSVWQAADGLGHSRLEASSFVEAMGLKVSHCQLGCFPRPKEG